MRNVTFEDAIRILKSRGDVRLIQATLNKLGSTLVVDGIFGRKTSRALTNVSHDLFMSTIGDVFKEQTKLVKPSTKKEEILNLLARLEGTRIHYNRGEKSVTLPYGLYIHVHRKSKPAKYFQYLLNYYNLTEGNVVAKQDIISKEHMDNLIDMIYEYYLDYIFNRTVMETLTDGELYVYISNTILAQSIGMKALQYALGVKDDGIYGPITDYVFKFKAGKEALGHKMLDYMRNYLISLNNKRYIKGWMNRLDKVASYL